MTSRPGPHCIATISGRVVDLAAPTPDMIDIEDIAHALSLICRYNGHVEYHYSVAQHSVLVHDIVDGWYGDQYGEWALVALMHDAAEAYLGDMARPLKLIMHAYRATEAHVAYAIGRAFDIDGDASAAKDADLLLYAWERRDVAHVPGIWDVPDYLVLPAERITPWPAAQAKAEFLERFRRYR